MFQGTVDIHKYSFDSEGLGFLRENHFVRGNWPLTYLISSERKKELYVGESTNAGSRISQHLKNPSRKSLSVLHIITSDKFNKSAVLDIEANLIQYLSADGKFKLQNANAGLSNHNYYQREQYWEVFQSIWKELKKEGIVEHELSEVANSDLFKYSPYKSLSPDQHRVITELADFLMSNDHSVSVVEGGAGTGKTILAVYLMKLLHSPEIIDRDYLEDNELYEIGFLRDLKSKKGTYEVAMVVPMTSLRKTIKRVFRNVQGLKPSMVIGPSDVVKKYYDLLIVDESHRLHQRKNITNYASFDNANKALGFAKDKTELDWILHQSEKQILFYDQNQSIRPSDIDKERFDQLKQGALSLKLQSQHRVQAPDFYISFIDELVNGRLQEESAIALGEYDLRLFQDLKQMIFALEQKEEEHGLCRLVAGYAWKWVSKNSEEADIHIGDLKLKWNSTNEDWINSENAFEEVGCIHTTQGYDLNFVGVIFGPEITYNEKLGRVEIIPDNYYDRNGKAGIEDPMKLHEYIVNIYKTLMLRGMRGTFIYVCDDQLRDYFAMHLPNEGATIDR